MAAHTEYRRQPVDYVGPLGRLLRAMVVVVVFFAFMAAVAVGGFEYGVASRPGDSQIISRQSAAVHGAVARAVAAKGKSDHEIRLRIMARHEAAQRSQFNLVLEQRLIDQQIADNRAAARAFTRGRAAARVAKSPSAPPG
jgi:hypothetical protein